MSYPVGFRPEASEELAGAVAWYEAQLPGLGESFLGAVRACLTRISEWPTAAQLVRGLPNSVPVRSAPMRRFPYRIVYAVDGERIRVLAVSHVRREPRYWQGRAVSEAPDEPATDLELLKSLGKAVTRCSAGGDRSLRPFATACSGSIGQGWAARGLTWALSRPSGACLGVRDRRGTSCGRSVRSVRRPARVLGVDVGPR